MTQTHDGRIAADRRRRACPRGFVGILFAPRATYADVAARPRWLGRLPDRLLVTASATFALCRPRSARNALLDQQITPMESFGGKMTEAADRADGDDVAVLRLRRAGAPAGRASPSAALIVAGIALRGVQRAPRRRRRPSSRSSPSSSHSGVILAVLALFAPPLAYARETLSSATNLAVFLPFLDENSFAGAVARVDRSVRHLVDRQPVDRPRRPLPQAHRADRDHAARRLRGDRADHRGRSRRRSSGA